MKTKSEQSFEFKISLSHFKGKFYPILRENQTFTFQFYEFCLNLFRKNSQKIVFLSDFQCYLLMIAKNTHKTNIFCIYKDVFYTKLVLSKHKHSSSFLFWTFFIYGSLDSCVRNFASFVQTSVEK